jgi:hypothetical protein
MGKILLQFGKLWPSVWSLALTMDCNPLGSLSYHRSSSSRAEGMQLITLSFHLPISTLQVHFSCKWQKCKSNYGKMGESHDSLDEWIGGLSQNERKSYGNQGSSENLWYRSWHLMSSGLCLLPLHTNFLHVVWRVAIGIFRLLSSKLWRNHFKNKLQLQKY